MKRKSLYICHLLLMLALIPVFSGCNTEDDLIRIFTGKTWKMSRITIEGKENEQFGAIVWDSEAAYNQSIELLKAENNFTVVFEGIEVNGELSGNNVTVNGVKVKNATGTWTADGKNGNISLNLKISASETDPLAKEFIKGMQNVFKYEGDENQITLYYKEGQTTCLIGFAKQ
ncbi:MULTISPECIES: DUF4847 family protein [Bacteroides]|uniref:DUF4847 family protein n=1 Tax=Bacteroides TaxID=816 RepID=UPI0008D958DC|nr:MULTISPECIES: DUF4847 family protein [Bacteroides]MDO3390983.1 DUF4847 family protein [Bacteroides sp. ET489]